MAQPDHGGLGARPVKCWQYCVSGDMEFTRRHRDSQVTQAEQPMNSPDTTTPQALLSSRVLKRSLVWNAVATILPLLAAVLAVPFLISGLGGDRFGLLTLVWAIVGYSGLFDLGVGRALTQMIAERLGGRKVPDLSSLLWTALWMLIGLGALAAVVLWSAAPSLVALIKVPPHLVTEAVIAFRILAFSLPFVFVTSALVGVLEAFQRFDVIAAVRVPMSILTTAGPLLTLLVSPSLVWISYLMLGARMLGAAIFCWRLVGLRLNLMSPSSPNLGLTRHLIGYGGWLTVSNVIGPLLTYLDRFFVGAILGTVAVAHYVMPYEILSRLGFLPSILLGVIFPALTMAFVSDSARVLTLYKDASALLRHSLLALCLPLYLFAQELLALWLNADLAAHATPVVQWLAVGTWVNVLARTPLAFLQGVGRADLAAKSHLAELIPYLTLLVWWTQIFGIAGTAAAWTVRVLVDTLMLNYLACRVNAQLLTLVRHEMLWLCGGLLFFVLLLGIESLGGRLVVMLAVGILTALQLYPYVRRAMTHH